MIMSLAVTPRAQFAIDAKFERLGFELQQRLRRQHVFDFAGPDPEGERTERAVGGRVRVAADDRHAGLGVTVFGADDVNDALADVADVKQRDAEFRAVGPQGFDLLATDRVSDRQAAVGRGNVVVGRGDRALRTTNGTLVDSQSFERLRAGDFMDQMQVDVDNRRSTLGDVNEVAVPDFVQHGPRGGRR